WYCRISFVQLWRSWPRPFRPPPCLMRLFPPRSSPLPLSVLPFFRRRPCLLRPFRLPLSLLPCLLQPSRLQLDLLRPSLPRPCPLPPSPRRLVRPQPCPRRPSLPPPPPSPPLLSPP